MSALKHPSDPWDTVYIQGAFGTANATAGLLENN